MKYTAKFWKTPPPQAFYQLYDEEDAERGVRPAALLELRPQGPVQRHTALNIVDLLPYVQIIDVPVPQMGRLSPCSGHNPTAFCGSSSAEGRTVGGSAHDHVLHFSTAADCGANR